MINKDLEVICRRIDSCSANTGDRAEVTPYVQSGVMDSKLKFRTHVSFAHFSSNKSGDADTDDESTLFASDGENSLPFDETELDVILTNEDKISKEDSTDQKDEQAALGKEGSVWGTIRGFCLNEHEGKTLEDATLSNQSANRLSTSIADYASATASNDDTIVVSLERCLDAQRSERGSSHPSVIRTLNGLAAELQSRGRYDEAIERLSEAVELVSRKNEEEKKSEEMSNLLSSMGSICSGKGQYQESIKYYKAALAALIGSGLWEDHPKIDMLTTIIDKLEQRLKRYCCSDRP